MPTTIETAERLARETIEVLAGRLANAVSYAEAYGHDGRTVVIDGSAFSPSSRVLPNGSRVWDLDNADAWEAWDNAVSEWLDTFEVHCDDSDGREDDPSYVWTFSWDNGCLFGIHPDDDDPDH